jgi:hypothetical protein
MVILGGVRRTLRRGVGGKTMYDNIVSGLAATYVYSEVSEELLL